MNDYIKVGAGYLLLSCYVFLLTVQWHEQLVKLAERYDLAKRRRKASCRLPIFVLALMIPCGAVTLFTIRCTHVDHGFLILGVVVAVVPAMAWWLPKTTKLKKLGYGRHV